MNETRTPAPAACAWARPSVGQCVIAAVACIIHIGTGAFLHTILDVRPDPFAWSLILAPCVGFIVVSRDRLRNRRITGSFCLKRIVEARSRDGARSFTLADDVVEVGVPHEVRRGYLELFFFLCFIISASLLLLPEAYKTVFYWVEILGGTWALVVIACLWARGIERVVADAQGLLGYASNWALRRTLTPWSEIESCEIETVLDSSGKPIATRPVFKDPFGNVLMRLDIRGVSAVDTDRLLKFIRIRFPRAVLGDGPGM